MIKSIDFIEDMYGESFVDKMTNEEIMLEQCDRVSELFHWSNSNDLQVTVIYG